MKNGGGLWKFMKRLWIFFCVLLGYVEMYRERSW